ncbi:hypothetical protein D8Y22_17840 [Salinadaptatus halalkaliphilus]|uniref:Uncharacterized protein n=1 Tax=Salinadaptatus halalkaliphilus TaxID=2419781 RepID=A0A4S3TI06_9EURY|nr:hypothetical protein [Salinadaptatus halalkaliphilus]THE63674.1 hypothetical protein D8Y22_17840 [Salinadaptatus halalkaliphilus]
MDSRTVSGYVLLAVTLLALAVVYLGLVPRTIEAGTPSRAVRYLVAGWVPYTLCFYLLGRLFSSPAAIPSMRSADVGLGLFLVSLLLSLGLEAWGFSPEVVPEAHLLQALGIFVGLALLGWGLGRRSHALADPPT